MDLDHFQSHQHLLLTEQLFNYYAPVFEISGLGLMLLSPSGHCIWSNAVVEQLDLAAEHQRSKRTLHDLIFPADRNRYQDYWHGICSGRPVASPLEVRFCKPNGLICWMMLALAVRRDASGDIDVLIGLIRDISSQKQIEAELRDSQGRLQALFDSMEDFLFILDRKGRVLHVNPVVIKRLGYGLEELLMMTMGQLHAPSDQQEAPNLLNGIAPGRTMACDASLLTRAGIPIPVETMFSCAKWGEQDIVVCIARDVTERQSAQQQLQQSEQRYRRVFENSGAPAIIIDRELTITMANHEFERLTGYPKSKLEGRKNWCEFIASEEQTLLHRLVQRIWQDHTARPVDGEFQLLDRQGRSRHIYLKAGSLPDRQSGVVSCIDITHRKQAELALREREAHLRSENFRLRSSIRERVQFGPIVGQSKPMQAIYEQIVQAAQAGANVIIYGESGTGKELVAKAIHNLSPCREHTFVPVNCGAIPETLLEREFFGHVRGAFTGADSDKLGYLDLAHGGTLFLDEIGEISANLQVKLLRAIDGGGYTPIGGSQLKHSDFVVIAATNQDLNDLVKKGLMREDFFYRIHIVPLTLPPLRERKDDLPLLIYHFLKEQGREKALFPIVGKAMQALLAYDWPGNVRELRNVLQRYAAVGRLDLMGIAKATAVVTRNPVPSDDGHLALRQAVKAFERRYIANALEQHQWHRTKVAKRLGVSRKTLFSKMKQYNLG